MSNMTLDEMAPYIMGKEFTKEVSPKHNRDAIDEFAARVGESITAPTNLELVTNWTDFYTVEPDFKHWIKSEDRAEAFYAVKLGFYSPDVPSMCIYMLQQAYDKHKSPNLIFKMIPNPMLENFFAKGYLGNGYTIHDVVCNFCDNHYYPLSADRLKNSCSTFTEIYVQSTDMVALVPNRIAETLSNDAIDNIVVTPNGLSTNGLLLSHMGGYKGLVNSVYDLRKLI